MTSPAHADPFHHQPLPMGQRALGMGGAFTGLANDPSATFYNPAGLARLEATTISASLSLSTVDHLRVERGYRTRAGNGDLTYSGRPSLPLFIGLARRLGKKDEHGSRHHAIAFSTFSVDNRSLGLDLRRYRVDPQNQQWLSTLYGGHDQSEQWYGLSYGYRFGIRFAFGGSLFLRRTKVSALEERLDMNMNLDGSEPDSRFERVRASLDTKSLVARLGFLYTEGKLRVGALLQPPSIHLKGKGSIGDRLVTTTTNAMGVATGAYDEKTAHYGKVRDPLPWEVRAGVAYQLNSSLVIDCDLSFDSKGGPVRAPWAMNATGRFMASDPEQEFGLRSFARVPTFNGAVGTEYQLPKKVTLQSGFFSDLSAAPRLPKVSPEALPDHMHRFGTSLSLGFGAKGINLALGTVVRLGFGQALAPTNDAGPVSYLRSDAREYTLFVFLTGARSAVSKLADVAIDKLNEAREQSISEQLGPEPPAKREPTAPTPNPKPKP
jgi:long-chain fatty acid transport protein